ncbi:MAG: tRNA (adenosine(37)-N6)-threonylcarbamoyltransferase complex dimerization subunit type 1 TsaB, partial [Paucibacter sp.]|nr:tRNA (adenosine(37)-N6)-threonylcarbamoyltransferase complex dimerization subunit type 1 TsaB [Roseateles sp.]
MTGLLSLDSSTETLAVALSYPGGRLLYEGAGGPMASERMVPEAMQLLARAGMNLNELDAVAFAAGPGAFTGLRTACAVAQGLALGANKPVLALDSLMLVAEDAHQQALATGVVLPTPLWVAVDARMNEIYAAAYERDEAGWRTLQAPALYSLPALQSHWEPAAVAGNALQLFEELRAELISDVPV